MPALPSLARLRRFAVTALIAATATATAVAGAAPAQAQPAGGYRSARPTVVLIHGAWSGPAGWNGEVQALQRKGYTVRAITNPLRQLDSDSAYVADFVRTIGGPSCWSGTPTAARSSRTPPRRRRM